MRLHRQATQTQRARGVASALAALVVLAIWPAVAPAATLHTETAFSPITGSATGVTINSPRGSAVDETSGNLFVTSEVPTGVLFDPPVSTINIFNSEGGVPAGVASPYKITGFDFANKASMAVDNSPTSPSKGTLYVADTGNSKVKKYTRNAGTEQYEISGELIATPLLTAPTGIAVDADGNVFVSSPSAGDKGRIVKFAPNGTQLAQIEPTDASRFPQTLAVDAAGDLFVRTGDFKIFAYPANGLGEIEESNLIEIPTTTGDQVRGLAVDPGGDILYAVFGGHVSEFDASSRLEKGDFLLPAEDAGGEIAVNHTGGFIYVNKRTNPEAVLAYNLNSPTVPDVAAQPPTPLQATKATLQGSVGSLGQPVTECKFEYDLFTGSFAGPYASSVPCAEAIPTDSERHAVSAQIGGLTPNKVYKYRLVTKNANGASTSAIKRFTTEKIAKTTAASDLTVSSATLNGVVRPEGAPVTACSFEYGLTASYGSTVPCSPEPGAIPTDFEPHGVSANVSGLLVGTTYHYRVVATGDTGTEDGGDLTFTTIGPSVNGKSVSAIGDTSAKLDALINPHGKETAYHFEYGAQGPCDSNPCTSAPVPDGSAGSGSADVPVSELVKGLSPATTYHYRVVVSNADGVGHSSEGAFTTFNLPQAFDPCANDPFRGGHPSAKLPDCRAYEQASPIDKNGGDAGGQRFKVQASLAGDAITFHTQAGVSGGEGSGDYPIQLSRRGASGWSTQGLFPPPLYGDQVRVLGWTPDLAYSFSAAALTGSDQLGKLDSALLARSSASRSVEQLVPYTDGAVYGFAGASADDSKFLLEVSGPGVNLTGNATASKPNVYLYDRGTGELSLIGLLPLSEGGFAPPGGSFAGPFDWWPGTSATTLETGAVGSYFTQEINVISADGEKAFFTAGGTGRIYMRDGIGGEEPETVQLSASQRATPDPNGQKPAIFWRATPSGAIAYFTSCQKLTDDSTTHSTAANTCDTASQGQDLYAYDTGTHQLTDLTVDDDPGGAEVKGVLGAADDGAYVYFVANGDLDAGGPATAGDCQRSGGGPFNYSGSCNLYVWHAGASTFIAKLDSSGTDQRSDAVNWQPSEATGAKENQPLSRVSTDGLTVVFRSQRTLTPFQNELPVFYRYHFGDPAPTCISCDPTGRPSSDFAGVVNIHPVGNYSFIQPVLSRFVSTDGNRVFFETTAKLVGADTNGDQACPNTVPRDPAAGLLSCQDVYEWEAPETGSCTAASPAFSSQNQGCIYLLSSGTSPYPSYLGDASASGDDVFIFTRDQLVPQDVDQQQDLYDVRVGGGLASQNQPPPPPPCEGGACRGAQTPLPGSQSAGTASFQGPGDPPLKRCSKGRVSKRGKCVKPHKPKHHKKRAHKRAGAKQGGRK